jgi:Protein of unknown function (DUF3307)
MVIAMYLAHLVGDYVLQWDALARWKSRELKGALAHGMIVLVVTWLLSLPFDTSWWPWVVVIGLTHTAVDAATLWLGKRLPLQGNGTVALARYLIDQVVHVGIITLVLVWSGYLAMPSGTAGLMAELRHHRLLVLALGYTFVTLPAWILVQFTVYGLVDGSAPDFSRSANKYMGILERGLITTCVITGQFLLVPLVTLPRLILEGPQVQGSNRATLYVTELLASVTLAVAIGLVLRLL